MAYADQIQAFGKQPMIILELLLDDGQVRRYSSHDIPAIVPPPGADPTTAYSDYFAAPVLKGLPEASVKLDPHKPGVGSRATLSASLTDFPDINQDGFHFANLKTGGQFVENRIAKVWRGYYTAVFDWANFTSETWLIKDIPYPKDNGSVTVNLRDLLDRGAFTKNKAPEVSTGTLKTAIADASFAGPIGINTTDQSEYDLKAGLGYGVVRIDDELIRYTTVTPVTDGVELSGIGRGYENSTASSHEVDVSVLWALVFDDELASDVIAYLYENYAGVDPSYIPIAEWESALDKVGSPLLNAIITDQSTVNDLVNEICEPLQAYVYWDPTLAEIKLLPLEPQIPAVTLDNKKNIMPGGVSITEMHDDRLSRFIIYHGQRDRTQDRKEPSNYAKITANTNPTAAANYDQVQQRSVFFRWLGADQVQTAQGLAARWVQARSVTPLQVGFMVDIKDSTYNIGDVIGVTSVQYASLGVLIPLSVQIISKKYVKSHTAVEYLGQSFVFTNTFGVYAPDTGVTQDYLSASAAERLEYIYYGDDAGLNPDGTPASVYF